MSVYKLVCPCCHSRMRIRSSEGQTPCFRSMYAQCTNALCGATFTGSLSWDYQLREPVKVAPQSAFVHCAYIERKHG
ncbi:ogr/Delta-like zinc finger family protein, partial [Pseudomonas aeruginosa]|uniref:ogr/Delta-like zinc finger family protein n=1 Tax=Pseudomonas aeruginosa TaxID=287 RepID=UPI001F08E2F7